MVVTGKLWHIRHNTPWPHHLKSSQRVSAASGLFPAPFPASKPEKRA